MLPCDSSTVFNFCFAPSPFRLTLHRRGLRIQPESDRNGSATRLPHCVLLRETHSPLGPKDAGGPGLLFARVRATFRELLASLRVAI